MPGDLDIRAVRVALAAALNVIPGLTAHARYPGVINPPAAIIFRRETRYNPAVDLGADVTLTVRIYTSVSNPAGSQDKLDDYLAPAGALSLRAAIDADPTLGGTVSWCAPTLAEAEGLVDFKGVDYISADLVVEVG